jgi:hypothetical protein
VRQRLARRQQQRQWQGGAPACETAIHCTSKTQVASAPKTQNPRNKIR